MKNKQKTIVRILEAIEKSVDTGVDFEWEDINTPETEETPDKVKDTGDHKMPDGKFTSVKDKAPKAIDTKPSFDKAKDTGVKGGAQQKAAPKAPKKMTKEDASAALKLIKLIEKATGKKVALKEYYTEPKKDDRLSQLSKLYSKLDSDMNYFFDINNDELNKLEPINISFNGVEASIDINAENCELILDTIQKLIEVENEFFNTSSEEEGLEEISRSAGIAKGSMGIKA